jgi:hypothetical protein
MFIVVAACVCISSGGAQCVSGSALPQKGIHILDAPKGKSVVWVVVGQWGPSTVVSIRSQPIDIRREPSTSCEAAVRVKPTARLCEPWVTPAKVIEPPEGRHRLLVINPRLFTDSLSPPRGSANLTNLTQGSQSLALGLTLTAAPQLVEGSRLISIGCDRSIRRYRVPAALRPPDDTLALRCVKYMSPLAKPHPVLNSAAATQLIRCLEKAGLIQLRLRGEDYNFLDFLTETLCQKLLDRYLTSFIVSTTTRARLRIVAVPTTTFSPSRRLSAVVTLA